LFRARACALPALTALLVAALAGPAAAHGPGVPSPFLGARRPLPHVGQPLPGGARAAAPTSSSAAAIARARSSSTRLVVQLAHGAPDAAVVAAARAAGGGLAHRHTALGFVSFDVPVAAADALRVALTHRRDVVGVQDSAAWSTSDYAVNDGLYSHQAIYLSAVHAPAAWDTAKGSSAVKIAVVDTGMDLSHPDLAGKVVGTYNAVAGAPSTTDVTDNFGHGTFVGGVAAAATDNTTGVAGVGFNSSLLAVKAAQDDGGFLPDDVAAGIVWAADHGARVVNLSLGGPDDSTVVDSAVSYAQTHGALVVAAAGNTGLSTPNYPAASPGVLSVGATDTTQASPTRASFSSYGSWVSVAAPGVGIYSTTPLAGSADFPGTSGYDVGDGTSFSSPIVAGEAALLAAAAPSNLTVASLRSAIVSSASGYAGLGLGTGQVDLAAALTKLPPSSVPTITSPVAAAVVGGAVSITASSSAPKVRFFHDGVALAAPVDVSSGSATAPWPTWGLVDGPHDLTAADCNANGCGDPSSPLSVTVQNAAPSVTSPAADAIVSNVVGVDVTTQNAPPQVRLVVDGVLVGVPVAVVADAAHLSWPSAGYPNGSHQVGAAVCDASGACGSSASVPVTLTNAAPVITSPKVGQVASGLMTVSATAPGGALTFSVGSKQVGVDTTSPYAVAVNFSAFADGSYPLTVKSCSSSGTLCNGPTVVRTISVKSLHPSLAATSSFSPNGDKRLDVMSATVTLPDTEKVYWTVRNGAGTVVKGGVGLGYLAAGKHTFTWNGYSNAGSRVPDGLYTVSLSTSNATATKAATLFGSASRSVRVDVTAPVISAVSGVTPSLYPYPDGYKDSIVLKVTVNEGGVLSMIIKNSSGAVVRTIVANHSSAGVVTMTWNGYANGALAPAGSYHYSFLAQDSAQNRRASGTYNLAISAAKLVGTVVARTVTPAATKTSVVVGSCSRLFADSAWSGGYDYESGYDYYAYGSCPDPYDSTLDIVGSYHQITLPAAVKYAGISVVATGREEEAGYGDVAYAWYRDTAGNAVGGVTLGSSYASYSLGAATPSLLYGGRTLRWTVATDQGQFYALRTFTVRYTYYVLK
jgi:flagellar hook assembly protein FlgD